MTLTNKIDSDELFLGIDGGGTKCKAILVDSKNQVLGTGVSGPANPFHGFEQATQSIVESAKIAISNAGLGDISLNNIHAGIGLAGVNLPALFEKMSKWQQPFKRQFLTTDLSVACLGAHNGQDGAVIVIGTGSCGYSFIDNKVTSLGGYGFPYGDNGSGAWLGFKAAQHVLLAIDGLAEKTSLTEYMLNQLNVNDALSLVEVLAGKPAAFFAVFAKDIFQHATQGDDVAQQIIQEGADYISALARKLLLDKPPRTSFIGGLSPLMTPWLANDVKNILSPPLSSPEMGAVMFAKKQLNLL